MKEKIQLGMKSTQRKQILQYQENVEKKIPSEKCCNYESRVGYCKWELSKNKELLENMIAYLNNSTEGLEYKVEEISQNQTKRNGNIEGKKVKKIITAQEAQYPIAQRAKKNRRNQQSI